jgi:branched-chain amino acid transport system ATP-binding protein
MSASVLAIRSLSVSYGAIAAVRNLTLEVKQNEIVTLLGPNGAGKSSVLNACMGLTPSGGTIALAGASISGVRTESIVRQGMTMVPEGRRVFAYLTVLENLRLGAGASPKLRSKWRDNCERMFELFPRLRERQHQLAGTLSGGEQQMLAIARSLMSTPRLLLLDEPSLGLAPNIVDQIFDLIVALKNQGLTILLVEQNVELSLDIADRGYVLSGGCLVIEGTTAILRGAGDFERAYLGGH